MRNWSKLNQNEDSVSRGRLTHHYLAKKPFDLLRIVRILQAVAVSVARIELRVASGDEPGHLALHAGVNHTILFPPDNQYRATDTREDTSIVEIQ